MAMNLEVPRDVAIRMLVAVAQAPTDIEHARLSKLSDSELASEMAAPATARSLSTLTRELVSSLLDESSARSS